MRIFDDRTLLVTFNILFSLIIHAQETENFKRFSTKNHSKANGIEMQIDYPSNWTQREGYRPHIVQHFSFSQPDYFLQLVLTFSDIVSNENCQTSSELAKSYISKEMVLGTLKEQNAKLVDYTSTKIENIPAALYKYQVQGERAGRKLSLYVYCLQFLHNRILVQITFSIAPVKVEAVSGLTTFAESQSNLFFHVCNSVVLIDKWTNSSNTNSNSVSSFEFLSKQVDRNINNSSTLIPTNTTSDIISQTPQDRQLIETLITKAYSGDAEAQFIVGNCYARGDNLKKDPLKAILWYSKSAEQGFARAKLYLGLHYQQGIGVDCDKARAFKYYQQAALQGDAMAQFSLAVCYRKGIGTGIDPAMALLWLHKSKEQGYKAASKLLDIIYSSKERIVYPETILGYRLGENIRTNDIIEVIDKPNTSKPAGIVGGVFEVRSRETFYGLKFPSCRAIVADFGVKIIASNISNITFEEYNSTLDKIIKDYGPPTIKNKFSASWVFSKITLDLFYEPNEGKSPKLCIMYGYL
jgi:hypothetical protein